MKNLWEMWAGGLNEDYCNYIMFKAAAHASRDATIGFDGDAPPDHSYRSSTIRWLNVYNADADIADTLMKFIQTSNRNNFGFDLWKMNEIQYTEYYATENGKYDWHHDVHFENPAPFDRKLSIVVQLSDPTEYEGGKFEFFNMPTPGDEFMQRGSVLVFPSFFPHRVLPVTKGKRTSLVSWIEGPKFR